MGCTSAKPNVKTHHVHHDQSCEPLSENGSFTYEYAAPASVVANQGIAPKATAIDSHWQLHANPHHKMSRIRRVNITVEATPTTSPQLNFGTPFDYKPPLTAMTADSKQSYFMYAESSAPDIRAPREEMGFAEENIIDAYEEELDEECSTSAGDDAPINHSGSHGHKRLDATTACCGNSRRLDETWLEFHNAGRSEADATDIQEERINEVLLEARENENEEATPAEAADTSRGDVDHRTDSHHSHPLGKVHNEDQTIHHSSSGKLTTVGNALQSRDDLAQSPVHRNANALLIVGKDPRNSVSIQDFPFVHITQPTPFLSKSRHESVRDWLVHVDLTKLKEPVSPHVPNMASATANFAEAEIHTSALPSEAEPAAMVKKVSGNTLSSFHGLRHCSIEGMTDDTATIRSSPSTIMPTLVAS